MYFGAHVKSSGGVWHAIENGSELGAEAVQFFAGSPRTWKPQLYRDADAARFKMRTEKQRANQASSDYRDGLTEEGQGGAAYDRSAYRDAADRFSTAEKLYAKAVGGAVARPSTAGPAR